MRTCATSPPGDPLPLHPLEFRILLVLLEGPSHGYAIVREIESRERTLKRIYPANLYRRMRDLLAKRLVEATTPPSGAGEDPRRRYFRITAVGRRVAAAEASRLRGLVAEALASGLLSADGGPRS